ncbi:MAG: YceH family protein [bacterium]
MQLTPIEVRLLGALIEKESTTPDAYPLSLNALVNACNQSSNRDPIMDLTDDAVRWAINNLRQQSLVRANQRSDSRVMKYQHLMTERLNLDAPALAVMCVLMLRGPQTTGEIRGRTNRLAEFASLADVEAALSGLVGRELVVELPRRPGQKEERYAHLLSGPVSVVVNESDVSHTSSSHTSSSHTSSSHTSSSRTDAGDERIVSLEATVAELRNELAELRTRFEEFQRQFG